MAAEVTYSREFIPLINDADCAREALAAARESLGPERVVEAAAPITASEDFAQFLRQRPGCFALLGTGLEAAPLHSPVYDFEDSVLIDGARWFCAIARRRLPAA